ncbi:hypothetical protein KKJ26_07045 [Xenorhabdus bovienii]|uniref:hypothetical protein n=1 Tax=Xenorhabdus bovienii TaxID=40576 RepID=UPI0023B243B4|nr:hypothetical protein [Xenorhabdus bovienii]MDE9465096.1 hypothetical protein [Xenorhabdus bovienii]
MPSPAKIWEQELLTLHARLAPLFHSTGPRQCSLAYQPFVLAIPCNTPLWWQGPEYICAERIADTLTAADWKARSAGTGTKGER